MKRVALGGSLRLGVYMKGIIAVVGGLLPDCNPCRSTRSSAGIERRRAVDLFDLGLALLLGFAVLILLLSS